VNFGLFGIATRSGGKSGGGGDGDGINSGGGGGCGDSGGCIDSGDSGRVCVCNCGNGSTGGGCGDSDDRIFVFHSSQDIRLDSDSKARTMSF
jgi:hypothetical protein